MHSFIIDLNGSDLADMFTTDEIKEIEEESCTSDLAKILPESISDNLMNLNGKVKSSMFYVYNTLESYFLLFV